MCTKLINEATPLIAEAKAALQGVSRGVGLDKDINCRRCNWGHTSNSNPSPWKIDWYCRMNWEGSSVLLCQWSILIYWQFKNEKDGIVVFLNGQ